MKRLTPGTVTIGVFAILFGLAAAYAARRYLDVPAEVAKPAPRPKTVGVVYAKINLPTYSRLRDRDVAVKQVPVDKVPEGAMTSKSRALFRVVKSTIMADRPIREEDLFGVGDVPNLSDRLPSGFRAVTISVSADSALNGMVQPDSHVDLTLTIKDNHPEVDGLATMTVMRNVLVLATSEARFPTKEEHASKLRNITVAVSPEDANKLILAQRYGTLSLTLRGNLEDAERLATVDGDSRDLVNRNILLGLPPLPVPAPPVVIQKKAEVWRGGKRVEVTFHEGEILEAINATEVSEGRQPMEALPVSVQEANTVSSGEAATAKKGCKNCGKKKEDAKAASATTGTPTQAPNAGGSSHVAGQVLEIQVEAEQVAPGN